VRDADRARQPDRVRAQWSKAHVGWDAPELPREASLCSHTVAQRAFFEVEDAAADPRFTNHPLVQGPPGIRFYAGARS
jgi:GAF domain-containing protein